MAADIALYVFADPLHAALILASSPGTGFDDDHVAGTVEFRIRGDGPAKRAMLRAAKTMDAAINPLLDDMRARATATLQDVPADRMIRGTNIPLSRLPGDKMKAMGLAERAIVRPGESTVDDAILVQRYFYRAFVIDAEAYRFLLLHAEQNKIDVAAVRAVLDAGFGRTATLLAE